MPPPLCSNGGPLICLNSAFCNETSGFCEGCPVGFVNDESVFRGMFNCGLSLPSIYATYFIAAFFCVIVAAFSLVVALRKKKSNMRKVLFLVTHWTTTVPFYFLAHYLEGFRHGPASITLFIYILMLVNTQVLMVESVMGPFIASACNFPMNEIQSLRRRIKYRNFFWLLCKAIAWLVTFPALLTDNFDVFNSGMLFLLISLLFEISFNIIRAYRDHRKLIRAVARLHHEIQQNVTSLPVIVEFTDRVKGTIYLMPGYGVLFFLVGVVYLILYIVFHGAIPYFAFVSWSINMLLWPLVGLSPVLLVRTKLGKQMDKTGTNQGMTSMVGAAGGSITMVKGVVMTTMEPTSHSHNLEASSSN